MSREAKADAEAYELWTLWKAAHERIESAVVAAATAASDLTDSEIAVLRCLEAAGGRIAQSELGQRMGWERSRLFHQVTRMKTRGLVVREGVGLRVRVSATPEGVKRLGVALPVHLDEVQRRLVDPVPDPVGLRLALKALLDG